MKLQSLTEKSLSRIHSKIQSYACGAITAYRGQYNHKENQQRNRSLLAKLLSKGYSVTSIQGSYIEDYGKDTAEEVTEHTFFVCNRLEGDDKGSLQEYLVQLGKEFDQDSILSLPFQGEALLIGTSAREDSYPGLGVIRPQGSFKGGKEGEFMSRVYSKAFIFEDIEAPSGMMGRWGVSSVAKQDWRDVILNDSHITG